MLRPVFIAAAVATLATAGAASAQTYGQPVYLNAYGQPVGGTPISEVETRAYVGTGRWADGHSDRPQVYIPVVPQGQAGGHYRAPGYRHGYRSSYGHARGHHGRPSGQGYRDEWGYNDDRHPSARGTSHNQRRHRRSGACDCGPDVYVYDR